MQCEQKLSETDPTCKMNFTILTSMSLLCGLILAQNDGDPEKAVETQSCFPDMCDLLKEFGALREKVGTLESKLRETNSQVLELKSKERPVVVFSAATGGGGAIGPFSTATTVIYRVVKTNIGNDYNQSTGIFAAPVAGIYYFTFFYHAGGSHPVSLSLMKNNDFVVTAYDHQSSHDGADNGGNAAFLQLQKGDHVYIRLGANTSIWGNHHITTFSGFLVNPI